MGGLHGWVWERSSRSRRYIPRHRALQSSGTNRGLYERTVQACGLRHRRPRLKTCVGLWRPGLAGGGCNGRGDAEAAYECYSCTTDGRTGGRVDWRATTLQPTYITWSFIGKWRRHVNVAASCTPVTILTYFPGRTPLPRLPTDGAPGPGRVAAVPRGKSVGRRQDGGRDGRNVERSFIPYDADK